jgi:pentatricopeptide repeat protein
MQKFGTKKDVVIYSTMLKVLGQAATEETVSFEGRTWTRDQRLELAHDYLYEMELVGITPNVFTCNALLAVYCNSQVPERAEKCFSGIFARFQVKPDVHSYLALLRMQRASGDLAKALSVYARLKLARIKPSHLFFSTLLQCCVEQRSFDAGVQVIQDMRDEGLEPYDWLLKKFVERPKVPVEVGKVHERPRSNRKKKARQGHIELQDLDKVVRGLHNAERVWLRKIPHRLRRPYPLPRADVPPAPPLLGAAGAPLLASSI